MHIHAGWWTDQWVPYVSEQGFEGVFQKVVQVFRSLFEVLRCDLSPDDALGRLEQTRWLFGCLAGDLGLDLSGQVNAAFAQITHPLFVGRGGIINSGHVSDDGVDDGAESGQGILVPFRERKARLQLTSLFDAEVDVLDVHDELQDIAGQCDGGKRIRIHCR